MLVVSQMQAKEMQTRVQEELSCGQDWYVVDSALILSHFDANGYIY